MHTQLFQGLGRAHLGWELDPAQHWEHLTALQVFWAILSLSLPRNKHRHLAREISARAHVSDLLKDDQCLHRRPGFNLSSSPVLCDIFGNSLRLLPQGSQDPKACEIRGYQPSVPHFHSKGCPAPSSAAQGAPEGCHVLMVGKTYFRGSPRRGNHIMPPSNPGEATTSLVLPQTAPVSSGQPPEHSPALPLGSLSQGRAFTQQ